MELKFISMVILYLEIVWGISTHEPKVHEDINESNMPENIRKVRNPEEKFQPMMFAPPEFIYQKSIQPDLQKWRYHQQQMFDSANVAKIRNQLEKANAIQSKGVVDQTPFGTRTNVIRIPLEHRWKLIHPKFVTEKVSKGLDNEFKRKMEVVAPAELPTLTAPKKFIDKKVRRSGIKSRPQTYSVQEDDLDVGASENVEQKEQIDRQDRTHIDLSNNYLVTPHTIYLDNQNNVVENKDINALNSLLGKTPNAQLNGLKQLLHSQATNVARFTPINVNNHTPVNEHIVESPNEQTQLNINHAQETVISQKNVLTGPNQLQSHIALSQRILQQPDTFQSNKVLASPSSLNQLQAQLDVVAQKQAHEAIAQAQQQALEHIKAQHQAIELAKIQAENIAFNQIKVQNLALEQAHNKAQEEALQAQAQEESQHAQNGGLPRAEALVQEEQIGSEQVLDPQVHAAKEIRDENARIHAQQQAQAYIQLAARQYEPPTSNENYDALHTKVYPTAGSNSYTPDYLQTVDLATKAQEEAAKHIKSLNAVAHAHRQAQAYTKSAAEAYSQPSSDIPTYYADTEDKNVVKDEPIYEQATNDEYASKYSFGYRINDYESGNDYSHEESNFGTTTKGRYHVLLPDGRVQNVEYWADPTGYHAKVTYSTVAHH